VKKNEAGMTFIEIMVVIAILSAVSAIAIFNLSRGTNAYVAETARERLIQELRSARAEAIARNALVEFRMVNTNTFETNLLTNNGSISSNLRVPFQLVERNNDIVVRLNNFTSNNSVIFDNRGRVTNIQTGRNQGSIQVRGTNITTNIAIYNTGHIARSWRSNNEE